MRTEIADFRPPGMKAPARAGLDRASEPKERFALPSEPADRRADRPAPASRAEDQSPRGRDVPADRRADPANVAAPRALDRASPRSALRRENASAAEEGAAVETGAAGEPRPQDGAQAPGLESGQSATRNSAEDPAQASTQDPQQDPAQDPTQALSQEFAQNLARPPAQSPPSSPDPAGDVAPDAAALAQESPTNESAPAGAAAPVVAAPLPVAGEGGDVADASGPDGRDAAALIVPAIESPAVAEAPATDDAALAAAASGPAAPRDGRAAASAADPASVVDLARDRSADGRAVAEVARALRATAAGDGRTGAAPAEASIVEGSPGEPEAGDAEKVESGQAARSDATLPTPLDPEGLRAGPGLNGAGDRLAGLFVPGGATDVGEAGADAAIRALQQAASSQPAALQAEAAGAAETGRPTVVVPQTALAAVPMAIGLKALNGVTNFQIRLDPAELGRVDVSLEIDGEGNVNAKLLVERVETLQLLQRDARTLERAFEQAGLKPSDGGIDMSLRDSGGERRSGREGSDEPRGNAYGRAGGSGDETVAVDPRAPSALAAQAALRRALGGVDVRI